MYSLGFDPGRSAGLALLRHRPAWARPFLVRAWSIWGGPKPRRARLLSAFREADDLAPGISSPVALGIETPAGGGASSKHAHGWQVSVGRSIGRAEVLGWQAGYRVAIVPGNVWPKAVGVRCGKTDRAGELIRGLHRIDEAAARVDGVGLALGELATTKAGLERQVCLAEAVLIALWASKLTTT